LSLARLLFFFIVFRYTDFFVAALALGISTFLTLILSKLINKRLPYFAIYSGLITISTSALTYFLKIPDILIIQDSIYYLLFFVVLLLSIIRKKYILKLFFEHIFLISDFGWRSLQIRWSVFFLVALVGNELSRNLLSPEAWVEYKKIAFLVFIVFGFYQFTLSSKTRLENANILGLRRG
jgi:intracellular septation protein A